MLKYAICPICKAQVCPNHANLTPRQELTNHLHYSDSQTWKRAKLMVKNSIVILEDDNGKEIERDSGRLSDSRNFIRDELQNSKVSGLTGANQSSGIPDFKLRNSSPQKDRYSGIPCNLWEYLK